jgi:hypothetical protein
MNRAAGGRLAGRLPRRVLPSRLERDPREEVVAGSMSLDRWAAVRGILSLSWM